ncbi:prepilin peptidase [Proteinivorax hydrogeniformans]|uniref:Prepilin peptidase n=1 Tax=Proteinivorax hydrogeniformans TaxID=1826727 RepID=A0AAU8HQX7_9FIRM
MQAIVIIFGLMVGSFCNVLIYRLPRKKSIVFPSSHCINCKTRIKIIHLIPLIGFLVCKGKCHNCNSKISLRYPLIETLTAALFLLTYNLLGLNIEALFFLNLAVVSLVIAFIDLKHLIIPDELNIWLTLTGTVYVIYTASYLNIFAAIAFFTFFYAVAIISKGGMGGGDIKYVFPLGLHLGIINGALMLLISFVIGGIVGITLLSLGRGRKTAVPFGPFLATATFITIFWGDSLIDIYLRLVINGG